MAKGDTGGATGMGVPQAPKQDQYSVMHKLMDSLGGAAGSLAPSAMPSMDAMPRSPDQGQMGMTPNSNQFGGPTINYPQQPNANMGGRFGGGMGLPRMGSMYGVDAGASMAPSNPQELMRRTIMSKGVFGQ